MSFKFKHAVIGGTFDQFHKGHRLFIDEAFKISEKVTIGLSTEKLTKGKVLENIIQPYRVRKNKLQEYFREKEYLKRAKIIPIKDFYGNTLKERNIDAIFSDIKNSEKITLINEKREKLGFGKLKLVNVPLVLDEEGQEISSTRIRTGKIDKNGKVYLSYFRDKNLVLPKNLREHLRKPFGDTVRSFDKRQFNKAPLIIAVGDIVVSTLIQNNITPDLSIYDLHTKKKRINDEEVLRNLPNTKIEIGNNAGTIRFQAVDEIEKAVGKAINGHQNAAIRIIGEEDLLALPSILLSPLRTKVIYGLRDKGAVIVDVTPEIKNEIVEYVTKFTS